MTLPISKIYFTYRVSEHVDDDLDLPMADLTDILQLEDEQIIANPALIADLEEVVMGWERHMVKVIENCLAKVTIQELN